VPYAQYDRRKKYVMAENSIEIHNGQIIAVLGAFNAQQADKLYRYENVSVAAYAASIFEPSNRAQHTQVLLAERLLFDAYERSVREFFGRINGYRQIKNSPLYDESTIDAAVQEFRQSPVFLTTPHTELDTNPLELYPKALYLMGAKAAGQRFLPMRSSSVVKMLDKAHGLSDPDNPGSSNMQFGPNIVRNPGGGRVLVLAQAGRPIGNKKAEKLSVCGVHSTNEPDIAFVLRNHPNSINNSGSANLRAFAEYVYEELRGIPAQSSALDAFSLGNHVLWQKVFRPSGDTVPIQLDNRFDRMLCASHLRHKDSILRHILTNYENASLLQGIGRKILEEYNAIDLYPDGNFSPSPQYLSKGTDFFWDTRGPEIRAMRLNRDSGKLLSASKSRPYSICVDPDIIAGQLEAGNISPSLFMIFAPLALAQCKTAGGNMQIAYQPWIRKILSGYAREIGEGQLADILIESQHNEWAAPIWNWTEFFDLLGQLCPDSPESFNVDILTNHYRNQTVAEASCNFNNLRFSPMGKYAEANANQISGILQSKRSRS
jgi:hypothetical protein